MYEVEITFMDRRTAATFDTLAAAECRIDLAYYMAGVKAVTCREGNNVLYVIGFGLFADGERQVAEADLKSRGFTIDETKRKIRRSHD